MNLLYHAVRKNRRGGAVKIATTAGGWFVGQSSDDRGSGDMPTSPAYRSFPSSKNGVFGNGIDAWNHARIYAFADARIFACAFDTSNRACISHRVSLLVSKESPRPILLCHRGNSEFLPAS